MCDLIYVLFNRKMIMIWEVCASQLVPLRHKPREDDDDDDDDDDDNDSHYHYYEWKWIGLSRMKIVCEKNVTKL